MAPASRETPGADHQRYGLMATFKAYPNGATMGVGNPAPVGGLRGEVVGWSRASVRRHKRWLYSVVSTDLDGTGDAVTLTMKRTPETHEHWQDITQRLFRRLRDSGLIRWHWVVEWQRRGTPHLHLAVYGPEGSKPGVVAVQAWLAVAAEFEPAPVAQHITPITGPVGWLKYLSKHASRGVAHYQRHGKPEGWEKTGRLWGYGGSWPIAEAVGGTLTKGEFHRVRRMVKRWAIADARRRGDFRGVAYLRRMLACNDRALSEVRGVSEWVPGSVLLDMAWCAGWGGEMVPEPALGTSGSNAGELSAVGASF